MIIVGNGRMITRDPENPYFEDGAVVLDGSVITKAGPTVQLRQEFPGAEFIDAKHGVIMPAFINTHEHIYSAMARGLTIHGYNPKGFLDILDGMWWTIDRNLSLEQIRQSARATYIESVKNGVTTVFDHHASYGAITGSLYAIEDAAGEMGVRTCLCYEVSDRDGKEKSRQAIRENEDFIKHAQNDTSDMIAGMMGLHASFTLSDETLERCAAGNPGDAGCHIHIAEGIDDLHHSLKHYGKRIVDRLMDFGILGAKTIAAHCIYINGHEMDLLRDTGTMVVHNPESNMGNACGCPPTLEIIHRGILTGLGTDGYTHDMIESYKAANVLHKHSLCDPNAGWAEIPQMLFDGNSKIAGRFFKKELGVLKEGAAADVIILDYLPHTPFDDSNCNGHILFGMTGKNVVTTICNGKVLMKDRALCGIDEEKAMFEIRNESAKLWNQLNGLK